MNDSADETVIRTLIEDWAAAVRREDMEGILRDHAEEIVLFDLPPPLESRGSVAYKATWRTGQTKRGFQPRRPAATPLAPRARSAFEP